MDYVNFLYIGILVIIVLVGLFAFRKEQSKQASEIEKRVLAALKEELQGLQRRITQLEEENTQLSDTLRVVKNLLRQRGLMIIISGDTVTIEEDTTSAPGRKRSISAPIKKTKLATETGKANAI